jgi:hypothetical protein
MGKEMGILERYTIQTLWEILGIGTLRNCGDTPFKHSGKSWEYALTETMERHHSNTFGDSRQTMLDTLGT